MSEPRTFAIRTFGCQMNEHDSERLAGRLRAAGLVSAADESCADVVVLNTCTIRENADLKLFSALGHLKARKREHPGLQIVVGGCLAQHERERIRERAAWVDVVVGTHNLLETPALLERSRVEGPLVVVADAPDPVTARDQVPALTAERDVPWAAWMTIQTGCDNSCSYCIVPEVRGGEISRPMEDLVAEAEMLARRGVAEITLLGQNVNSYGRDLTGRGTLFGPLLRALGAVAGIERIRFTSPHPKDLGPDIVAAMAETAAVCPQLHLPLQSGSDRVLTAMRRGYRAARYLERLAMARAAVADLAVTTDLIVGYPGETDADFEDTLAVVAEAHYDGAYTFVFSPREGTRAAGLGDSFIDPGVVRERFDRLKEVVDRSALARHQARVGRLEEVLVEGPGKRSGQVSGRTLQGKLVHLAASAELSGGTLAEARIDRAAPYYLTGTVTRVLRPPRHRRRIALSVS